MVAPLCSPLKAVIMRDDSSRILSHDENARPRARSRRASRTLADSMAFVERGTARFVAHVRAIRQIVRAELPRKKLV